MAIDRILWKPQIRNWPTWPCPACGATALRLEQAKLQIVETGPSASAHQHDAWEVEWVDERFTGELLCGNAACKNAVVVCGAVQNELHQYYDHEGATQSEVLKTYVPSYFQDVLPVFSIAGECPAEVSNEMSSSFGLLWCDVSSAGNRLRVAVEALLTERKVPRTVINVKGKRQDLKLHSRIEKFGNKNAEAAASLLAIKWLGNKGSHASLEQGLTLDDLLDAYELFEHAIDLVYVRQSAKMKKLAAGINKRRGSTRKKKKSSSPR